MTDNNNFKINVKIDGRNYPLQIDRKNEEKYRLAAKIVNETVRKYREMYRDKQSTDILAMAAFQVALSVAEIQQSKNDNLFMEELRNLNDDISDFVKDKQSK